MYLKQIFTQGADATLQEAIYQRLSLAISRVAERIDETTMNSNEYKNLQRRANKIETTSIAGISKWEAEWLEGLNSIKRNRK